MLMIVAANNNAGPLAASVTLDLTGPNAVQPDDTTIVMMDMFTTASEPDFVAPLIAVCSGPHQYYRLVVDSFALVPGTSVRDKPRLCATPFFF
jgi:hypothetical protein